MAGTARHIECLDGLRGIAAFWILIGHSALLTGACLPLVQTLGLGVDLFILLSGFLMVFQYRLRAAKEPWEKPRTWCVFWVRRFFRIAPLYYVTLVVALQFGGMLLADRSAIDAFTGAGPQLATRYLDQSFANVILHTTFLFGLLPDYAYRTPLPDWSIGLEMQFYAAFPFLMLFQRRFGWTATALTLTAAAIAITLVLRWQGIAFPMPTFLPMKLPIFLSGMLAAGAIDAGRKKTLLWGALAVLLVSVPMPHSGASVVRPLLAVILFALVHGHQLSGVIGNAVTRASRVLGNRFFHWLGELSYGTYLWHLLVLQPIAALIIMLTGHTWPPLLQFVTVFAVVALLVYPLSWLTYRLIEMPGQGLGRKVAGRLLALGNK